MEFGERLKALREENELSREKLANSLNISYSTISKYETNIRFPDKDTLSKLADYFHVSIDYLVGRSTIRLPADKVLDRSSEDFTTLALSRKDGYDEDLPEEAHQEIEQFKEYIRHKYGKK